MLKRASPGSPIDASCCRSDRTALSPATIGGAAANGPPRSNCFCAAAHADPRWRGVLTPARAAAAPRRESRDRESSYRCRQRATARRQAAPVTNVSIRRYRCCVRPDGNASNCAIAWLLCMPRSSVPDLHVGPPEQRIEAGDIKRPQPSALRAAAVPWRRLRLSASTATGSARTGSSTCAAATA